MYSGSVIDNPVDTAVWRSEERLRLAQDAGRVASWEFDLVSGEVQSISGAIDGDEYLLDWRERGGPPLAGPPGDTGFGTGTTTRLASAQLGGEIDYAWEPDGLSITIRMPLSTIAGSVLKAGSGTLSQTNG